MHEIRGCFQAFNFPTYIFFPQVLLNLISPPCCSVFNLLLLHVAGVQSWAQSQSCLPSSICFVPLGTQLHFLLTLFSLILNLYSFFNCKLDQGWKKKNIFHTKWLGHLWKEGICPEFYVKQNKERKKKKIPSDQLVPRRVHSFEEFCMPKSL